MWIVLQKMGGQHSGFKFIIALLVDEYLFLAHRLSFLFFGKNVFFLLEVLDEFIFFMIFEKRRQPISLIVLLISIRKWINRKPICLQFDCLHV